MSELSKSFALAVPHDQAMAIRDDIEFFQIVRAGFVKATPVEGKDQEELDTAVRQIISRAIAADEVVDLFASAGLKSPDISILSDEFLDEVRGMPQKNLALEVLRKLLNDEIQTRSQRNIVQGRSFQEMLERSLVRYTNRTIETAELIEQLIELAKELQAARRRGEELGLTEEELAFYDALAENKSAVDVLGDERLRSIAKDLVKTVRGNATIDWTLRESAQARLRTLVKRTLRKYGYPPEQQEQATITVLRQAELFSRDWVA
jgi:type I restriction enzyme R subunit